MFLAQDEQREYSALAEDNEVVIRVSLRKTNFF
jgi:hypothetical protein